MEISPVYAILGLNVVWISGFTFVWHADSKAKADAIKECVGDKICKERMKALILQEDLKADGCQKEMCVEVENIKESVEKLKRFYGTHKHSKESGKVEGGELI